MSDLLEQLLPHTKMMKMKVMGYSLTASPNQLNYARLLQIIAGSSVEMRLNEHSDGSSKVFVLDLPQLPAKLSNLKIRLTNDNQAPSTTARLAALLNTLSAGSLQELDLNIRSVDCLGMLVTLGDHSLLTGLYKLTVLQCEIDPNQIALLVAALPKLRELSLCSQLRSSVSIAVAVVAAFESVPDRCTPKQTVKVHGLRLATGTDSEEVKAELRTAFPFRLAAFDWSVRGKLLFQLGEHKYLFSGIGC